MFIAAWLVTHLPKVLWERSMRRTGLQVSEALYADIRAAAGCGLGQALSKVMSEDGKNGKTWKLLSERVAVRSCVVAGALIDSEVDC